MKKTDTSTSQRGHLHGRDTPAVSVIVVTWNYGRFIRSALESLFDQTYQHFEVIVVDDGSTDDTATILRPYLDRITYLRTEHRGHTAARNEGIEASRGRYLCFFDADDICVPEKLEVQTSFMNRHPEVDFVFSDFCTFNEEGVLSPSAMAGAKRFQRIPYVRGGVHRIFQESLFDAYLRENFIFPGSLLVRREYALRVGVFDEAVKAKVFYSKFIQTIGVATVAYADKVLVKRRMHQDCLSKKEEVVENAWIELYGKFLENRTVTVRVRHRLLIRLRVSRSYWRLGCAAVRNSRVGQGRHCFQRSLMTWPFQRLAYAGLLATFLPRRFELVSALRRMNWP